MPRGHYDRKKAKPRGTGKKASKAAVAKGDTVPLELNSREVQVLRALALRLPSEGGGPARVSAFGMAMQLEPGEEGVASGQGMTAGAFAAALKAARIGGILGKREFVYRTAPFAPGINLPSIAVLWFKRVK